MEYKIKVMDLTLTTIIMVSTQFSNYYGLICMNGMDFTDWWSIYPIIMHVMKQILMNFYGINKTNFVLSKKLLLRVLGS